MNKECDLCHQSLTLLQTVMKQKLFHPPTNGHESLKMAQPKLCSLFHIMETVVILFYWLQKIRVLPSGACWVASAGSIIDSLLE